MYGVVFNHKLNMWTLIRKDTGKLISKHETKELAEKQRAAIPNNERDFKLRRK